MEYANDVLVLGWCVVCGLGVVETFIYSNMIVGSQVAIVATDIQTHKSDESLVRGPFHVW